MNTYSQTYTISVSDMDITYRITPNAILQYFQDTFARFLSTRNLAAFDIIKQNLIWVITDFEMKTLKDRPLWASDVTMKVMINEINSVRVMLGYQFFDEQNEAFAEGTSTWTILDTGSRRPFQGKEMMENAGLTETGIRNKRVILPKIPENSLYDTLNHLVNITDLDFNGHVSNRTYLAIAMGTIKPEYTRQYAPSYLHIKFKKESFFGQTLKCNIYKNEDEHFWYDILNEAGEDLCNVYVEWEAYPEGYQLDVSELVERR